MSNKVILHICPVDKFIPPFIEFIHQNFKKKQNLFILFGNMNQFTIKLSKNILRLDDISKLAFIGHLHSADQIILHSIPNPTVMRLLSIQPWLLSKCYWIIWGGDLYSYQKKKQKPIDIIDEKLRAFIIKRIGHFVTYIKGDYELAQKWYGAKGKYHQCLMYPSNLYKEHNPPPKQGETINVLVGNSADPSNNHAEVFEKLRPFKEQNMQIFCPLSYGQPAYAKRTAKLGKAIFGDKFTALLNFMPFDKYLELLGQIDIAVFAHKRQQAMGNTITLLGLGKKVYMRSDVTPWSVFSDLGIKVFDLQKLELTPIPEDYVASNIEIIKSTFSKRMLIKQYRDIFNEDPDHAIL